MTAPYSTGSGATGPPGSVASGSGFSQAALGQTPFAGFQTQQTTTEAPPGAAVSAYEYQQYVASARIMLGPQLGALLGLPADQAVTGDQVLSAYYDMPAGDMKNLQELLYGANMYANSAGEPLTARPVFGSRDIDSFNALSQLVLQAANTGLRSTADQIIQSSTSSGAAAAAQQNALSPLLGGGNTYQINLTNPQDVYQITNQIFQSGLGRLPTQAEYQAVLADVQQGQKASQGAQVGQQESMSQQRYQQQINSRTATHTPAAAVGNVPNGPFESPAEEAVAILQYGSYQVTPSNVAFLTAWMEKNGGVGNNPLGVSAAKGTDPAEGIQTAVNLLHAPQYQALDAILLSGNASTQQKNPQVQAELNQWSGGAITGPLDTKAHIQEATDAVLKAGGQQQKSLTPNDVQSPLGMSGNNRERMGLTSRGPSQNELAGAQPGAGGVSPPPLGSNVSPSTVPAAQAGTTQQGPSSPGDTYLPSSTITDVQAANPEAAAFMEETTGANTTPYYANQAQAGLQAIINLITQGPAKL